MATEQKKEEVKVRDLEPSKDPQGGANVRSARGPRLATAGGPSLIGPPVPSPRARG